MGSKHWLTAVSRRLSLKAPKNPLIEKFKFVMLNIIRKEIRKKRRNIPLQLRKEASQEIFNKIINLDIFINCQHIAFYLATENEIDTQQLITKAQAMGKSCYLPAIDPSQPGILFFVKYTKNDKLVFDKYGIPSPVFNLQNCIKPKNLDLAIIPLVAFDEHANRMGRGKGYYDRTFAYKLNQPTNNKPIMIGIAYEFQKTQLSPNSWDVPLQMVITKDNIYPKFKSD